MNLLPIIIQTLLCGEKLINLKRRTKKIRRFFSLRAFLLSISTKIDPWDLKKNEIIAKL